MDDLLEERDGIYYKLGTNELYTGIYETLWESSAVKAVFKVKDGKFHGEGNIYWDNGYLIEYISISIFINAIYKFI